MNAPLNPSPPGSLGPEARFQWLFDHIDTGFCIIEVKFDGDGIGQEAASRAGLKAAPTPWAITGSKCMPFASATPVRMEREVSQRTQERDRIWQVSQERARLQAGKPTLSFESRFRSKSGGPPVRQPSGNYRSRRALGP